jgi:fluoride exporter
MPGALLLLSVFVGGCAGGLARYAVTSTFPGKDGFPWSTLGVNLTGAFLLVLLLVLAIDVLPPSRYLRPALGSGFCGAYTTFSAVTVSTSELVRDGSTGLAMGYLTASLAGGVAAGVVGLVAGRSVVQVVTGGVGR